MGDVLTRAVFACLLSLAVSVPAGSQSLPATETETSEPDLSAHIGAVSDYRFRGISLSHRNPALQGGIDLEGENFFVGTWASTIAEYSGANVEIDVYAGLQDYSDSFGWTAGAYAYTYPGGNDVSYVELIATAESYVGSATLGVEASYAPRQDNIDFVNKYLGASAAFDVGAGFEVLARGGYEDGFYDAKWDWELGASYTRGPLTASLSYVDSNHGGADEEGTLARSGIVASLSATF